jgi:hypothetical protein
MDNKRGTIRGSPRTVEKIKIRMKLEKDWTKVGS